MTTLTLQDRVANALADFKIECWRDDWDVTVMWREIGPASRAPGLALYVTIVDGVTFEVPLQEGDDLAELFGAAVH
jgi:hypothetical protein